MFIVYWSGGGRDSGTIAQAHAPVGYDENNTANYNTKFHNRVLTQFSGWRLQIYASQGVECVVVEDENLKRRG